MYFYFIIIGDLSNRTLFSNDVINTHKFSKGINKTLLGGVLKEQEQNTDTPKKLIHFTAKKHRVLNTTISCRIVMQDWT